MRESLKGCPKQAGAMVKFSVDGDGLSSAWAVCQVCQGLYLSHEFYVSLQVGAFAFSQMRKVRLRR